MMIRLVQLGGYGDSAFYAQQDMFLCFYVKDKLYTTRGGGLFIRYVMSMGGYQNSLKI
jgi:hypothetical protein